MINLDIEDMSNWTTLHFALYAAKCGIPVFPCKPEDKKPMITDWPNRASTDVKQIHYWFQTLWPQAMIGAVTGYKSGIFILDIDVKDGIDAVEKLGLIEAKYGKLPKTLMVKTPSNGRHGYFRMPVGVNIRSGTNKYGIRGVDIRANGGYVIFAGSIRADGMKYEIIKDGV